jgi:hypothetical protein
MFIGVWLDRGHHYVFLQNVNKFLEQNILLYSGVIYFIGITKHFNIEFLIKFIAIVLR